MNEIKKCSLAGISFTLETDAYAALNEYIASLQNAYRDDPDGEEIVADIEARIAELILSAVSADAIVTKPLIMNIIKRENRIQLLRQAHCESLFKWRHHLDQLGCPNCLGAGCIGWYSKAQV